jgi:hypothetical protein
MAVDVWIKIAVSDACSLLQNGVKDINLMWLVLVLKP